MVRVLLNGKSKLTDQIQTYLRQWRMSVQRLPGVPLDFILHSRCTCDVIILTCADRGEERLCPGASVISQDMAPVLLVGERPRQCACQVDSWSYLPELGPDGISLRQAIDACLAGVRKSYQAQDDRHGYHQYAQFMNHELRTPITATSTALEILAQELARLGDERLLGFANIGLRNVQRLMQTITWSEGFLASRSQILQPNWCEWRVGELMQRVTSEACAREELAVTYADGTADCMVVSDANLFGTAVMQVFHALRYSAHGLPLHLLVQVTLDSGGHGMPSAGDPDSLELIYRPTRTAGEETGPGRVARSSLIQRGDRAGEEFLRLVDFTVSQPILELFQAVLTANAAPQPHEPWVTFTLPLRPAHLPGSRAKPRSVAFCT